MFTGGYELKFLGKRTLLPRGPAHLARMAKVPVCFAVCRRHEQNRLDIQINRPIAPPDTKQAELEMTKRLAASIEKCVLAEPGQWCIFRQLSNEDLRPANPGGGLR
jgi:lauroyl/myristoyl acyltransferase